MKGFLNTKKTRLIGCAGARRVPYVGNKVCFSLGGAEPSTSNGRSRVPCADVQGCAVCSFISWPFGRTSVELLANGNRYLVVLWVHKFGVW